jgi:hypothetical protein
MRYWPGLYSGVKQEMIEKGVQTMIKAAMRILERRPSGSTARLMLTEGEAKEDDHAGEELQDGRPDA